MMAASLSSCLREGDTEKEALANAQRPPTILSCRRDHGTAIFR
jgi:hypothetical protein